MSLCCPHHLLSPIYLPPTRKILPPHWLHIAFATQSLPKALYKQIANGSLGVITDQLSSEEKQEKFQGSRHCRHSLNLGWWKTDHLRSQQSANKSNHIPACGRSKMTLKYDQMAFPFTLRRHFPWRRLSVAKKLWIYFSTECKIRGVYQAKHTNPTKLALGVVTALFTKNTLQI